jgi:cytochrome c2
MWQRWKRLKTGEKVLFGFVALLVVVAVQNYVSIEVRRLSSANPVRPILTHYDFSGDGFHGSELFRKNNCSSCHRAIGNGTNMGLDLDGIGSRRDFKYLESFLRDPEGTYITRTVEHGMAPKSAAYVAQLPEKDRHDIAVFLSQLRADRGGAAARLPPVGKSGFIDAMLDMWVPDSWRIMFSDIRTKDDGADEAAKKGADGAAQGNHNDH